MHSETPLWSPSAGRIAASHLTAFTNLAQTIWNRRIGDYATLWQASIDHPSHFWSLVWDYCGVIGHKGETTLLNGESMQSARFFPDAQLNYCENLLRRNDEGIALYFCGEDQVKRCMRWDQLNQLVSQLQQAMRSAGIVSGDRVAGWMPNLPESVAAMLAATSLGAIWTCCPPDFGVASTLARFEQTTPRLLFTSDGYWDNGHPIDTSDRLAELAKALPSLERIVLVPYLVPASPLVATPPYTSTLEQFIAPHAPGPIHYQRFAFDHPLVILYSSGTNGKSRCIVHGTGGTLLQQMKEHQLHGDIHPNERLLCVTNCGWMMWNWQVSALACGATLLLYDGAPSASDSQILWRYAADCGATHLGVSANFLDLARKQDQEPRQHFDFKALRTLFVTGAPLRPENFDWVYQAVKADLDLASISGNVDSVSCFALGASTLPVYRGELQCRGLGMAVEVFDSHGVPLRGQKGELVCTQPFPSIPLAFWNDSDDNALRRAYFNHYPNVWSQGEQAEITEHQGLIMYGRIDATLSSGGVRIGSAEIYRPLECFTEIAEAFAVGQHWQDEERVILFVRMAPGKALDTKLEHTIKQHLRLQAGPHHVPAHVIEVADFPRTANGKLSEIAITKVLAGEPVNNLSTLANPEALKLFENLEALLRESSGTAAT